MLYCSLRLSQYYHLSKNKIKQNQAEFAVAVSSNDKISIWQTSEPVRTTFIMLRGYFVMEEKGATPDFECMPQDGFG